MVTVAVAEVTVLVVVLDARVPRFPSNSQVLVPSPVFLFCFPIFIPSVCHSFLSSRGFTSISSFSLFFLHGLGDLNFPILSFLLPFFPSFLPSLGHSLLFFFHLSFFHSFILSLIPFFLPSVKHTVARYLILTI